VKGFSVEPETMLEIGMAGIGLGILSGVVLLLVGRMSGDRRRGARHAEGPPTAGSVSPARHQNLSSSPR